MAVQCDNLAGDWEAVALAEDAAGKTFPLPGAQPVVLRGCCAERILQMVWSEGLYSLHRQNAEYPEQVKAWFVRKKLPPKVLLSYE